MAKVNKEFRCDSCDPVFDFEKIVKHTVRSTKCPKCGSKSESLISLPSVSKMADPRTVGSLIERNNKRNPLTREKIVGSQEDMKKADQQKHMRDLTRMTPEQKQRYIETGKK